MEMIPHTSNFSLIFKGKSTVAIAGATVAEGPGWGSVWTSAAPDWTERWNNWLMFIWLMLTGAALTQNKHCVSLFGCCTLTICDCSHYVTASSFFFIWVNSSGWSLFGQIPATPPSVEGPLILVCGTHSCVRAAVANRLAVTWRLQPDCFQ